ncbi:diacylglycerol kinase [Streptomyces bambusae]|uniref:diacylglycerol kinase n=1 Tax=Streptomyces bambusae TaxID=1550616 RepID=UPI001CFDD8A7|nr:diacylglycerol kinase [Streptomyces bambusae]MCB5163523.1 diacylglycerol kinase [Streptomyces bambusae]
MSPAGAAETALLVLVDPVARRLDGESVRIAKDVLCAGAAAKICLPDGPEEFARALARRGHRRPVIVGDDRALVRAVGLLRGTGGAVSPAVVGAPDGLPPALLPGAPDALPPAPGASDALSLVPVGAPAALTLARSLGVPAGAVAGARAALDGRVRRHDLLVDDSGGIVLGGLRLAPVPVAAVPGVWSACRSLVRALVRPPVGGAAGQSLRVEADGVLLADGPVRDLSLVARDGAAELLIRPEGGAPPLTARARSLTISGPAFRYRADHRLLGPVHHRTWTLHPSAWSLTHPH